MVITHLDLRDSYMIISDGSQRTDVQITTPNGSDAYYAEYAQPAIVAGKLYLFGGISSSDAQKIVRLDDCAMVELAVRLTNKFFYEHSTLAIDNGQKALICFGTTFPHTYCEVFDGTTAAATFSSAYAHTGSGNLGYYNGYPTSVSSSRSTGYHKVETMYEDGWRSLADHPENTSNHALVGLPNGDMLLIGGQLGNVSQKSSIWKLSVQGEWSVIGNLQLAVAWQSLILEGNSIYSFGGRTESDYSSSSSSSSLADKFSSVQRIDLTEDGAIEKVELISDLLTSIMITNPFLLLTDSVNSCVV